MYTERISRFQNRRAHVAVIGLGYVGLPLAVSFAQAGYKVTGIDLDRRKVEALNSGESYIEDVPSAVVHELVFGESTVTRTESVVTAVAGSGTAMQPVATMTKPNPTATTKLGHLCATSDFSVLADCDAVSICVPTPLNKTGEPEMSYIVAAAEQIAQYLHPGMVIVLESTTYPGTTTEVVLPILTRHETTRHVAKQLQIDPNHELGKKPLCNNYDNRE